MIKLTFFAELTPLQALALLDLVNTNVDVLEEFFVLRWRLPDVRFHLLELDCKCI